MLPINLSKINLNLLHQHNLSLFVARARDPTPQFTAKMNMATPVTPGTIQEMYEGRVTGDVWLQLINLKNFGNDGAQGSRYK